MFDYELGVFWLKYDHVNQIGGFVMLDWLLDSLCVLCEFLPNLVNCGKSH